MNPTLRMALSLLVLACMSFVAITGVVATHWICLFFALTASAPLTAKMQLHGRLVWRMAWNGGVFVIFAILVNDATRSGVRYMLQDGLILAAFCQVHLLNNLGKKQSPDLLFFNSFLIALVTCFFSDDLAFLLVMLPWVPLQLGAMQLATLARDERELAPSTWRTVLTDTTKRSFVAIALTGLAFVFVPRDFAREGYAERFFKLRQDGESVGFSDEIELGWKRVGRTDREVLRIERATRRAPWPSYWRGATMSRFHESRWLGMSTVRNRGLPGDPQLRRGPLGTWIRDPRTTSLGSFDVEILDRSSRFLFLPAETTQLATARGVVPDMVNIRGDMTAQYDRRASTRGARSPVEYRVEVSRKTPRRDELGGRLRRTTRDLQPYLWIGDARLTARVRQLAREILGRNKSGLEQHEVVERLRSALSQRQDYALPGEEGAAADLEEFLSGASGHCEYFASALALMLRSVLVPCRVATGYRIFADADTDRVTVRSKDAHAWVEVWDPEGGWYAVDATPAIRDGDGEQAQGFFASMRDRIAAFWKSVTGMDAAGRGQAIAWLRALPMKLVKSPVTHPFAFSSLVLMIALWIVMRRRRRQQRPQDVIRYEKALELCGLERRAAESPRELLNRAERDGLDDEKLSTLRHATERHELARYAGRA